MVGCPSGRFWQLHVQGSQNAPEVNLSLTPRNFLCSMLGDFESKIIHLSGIIPVYIIYFNNPPQNKCKSHCRNPNRQRFAGCPNHRPTNLQIERSCRCLAQCKQSTYTSCLPRRNLPPRGCLGPGWCSFFRNT